MAVYLSDTTLHNYKVRIVDIELYGLEECLDGLLGGLVSIQKVLGDIG